MKRVLMNPMTWVMLTRAGVKTSAQWDMAKKDIKLSLVAERNAHCDIRFPGDIATLTCSKSRLLSNQKTETVFVLFV